MADLTLNGYYASAEFAVHVPTSCFCALDIFAYYQHLIGLVPFKGAWSDFSECRYLFK